MPSVAKGSSDPN